MKKINILFILLLFVTYSCQEDKIETFDLDVSKIYFQMQNFGGSNGVEGYTTSMSYSFVGVDQQVQEVSFKGYVKLMGEVKDFDRPISLVVDEEKSTMPADGYEIDESSLMIAAGANSSDVVVRFKRTASLRTSADTLVLKLIDNEHFTVLNSYKSTNDWRTTTAADMDGSRYTFAISEVYKRPDSWHGGSPLYVNTYFGTWTATKFIFINEFYGFTVNDWIYVNSATSKLSIGRMHFYATQLQDELQRRADEGNPLYDEDGSYMQLPAPYSVNY